MVEINMSNTSIVQKAISSFKNGDYKKAKQYYSEAANIYGEDYFLNNIRICDLRILQESEGQKFLINEFKVDNLSLLSNQLVYCLELSYLVPNSDLEFYLEIDFSAIKNTHTSGKVLLLFDFVDGDGTLIENISGVGVSAAFQKHFKYSQIHSIVDRKVRRHVVNIAVPIHAKSVKVYAATLGSKQTESLQAALKGFCFSASNINKLNPLTVIIPKQDSFRKIEKDIVRSISTLNVACILDEFTTECLKHEVNLIIIHQNSWQEELIRNKPDFLLVESCWRGNGSWGTLTKGSGGGKKLAALLAYCKQESIPTVFWNKEDPPHYDKFAPVAKFFDLVITTDINMVEKYKQDFDINAYPLSFAAQPIIHNPKNVSNYIRENKAVFAGSYYGDKPDRCKDFDDVMTEVIKSKLDYAIYDRNYEQNNPKFAFPKQYKPNILGCLLPEDMWKAHKGYKYQINMNTVQNSSTMFARRVYESLASGTPVISNYSKGVEELFGNVVIMPKKGKSIAKQLNEIEANPNLYDEIARTGVRQVMRDHTYSHRIKNICDLLKINVFVSSPEITMVCVAKNEEDIKKAKNIFDLQTARNKKLFIELENFENAHIYLNKSTNIISYAMSFAKEMYENEHLYYGTDKYLKVDLSAKISNEALEDFLYWEK